MRNYDSKRSPCGVRKSASSPADRSLSANERSVLLLSFFENLSHSEISRRLGIPMGTVKSRIRLAFGKIRSALDEQDRMSSS